MIGSRRKVTGDYRYLIYPQGVVMFFKTLGFVLGGGVKALGAAAMVTGKVAVGTAKVAGTIAHGTVKAGTVAAKTINGMRL